MLCVRQAARRHHGQPPALAEVQPLQAGVLLRRGLPARALEAGRPQAGVQGAHGLQHLLGQRRPAAAHPGRMRVPGRSGVRARSVPGPGCRAPGIGFHEGWYTCTTCKQQYTGAMQLGLAEALWERHRRKPARNQDRLAAQNLLAAAYMAQGRHAEAEELFRELLAAFQRLAGADHENTLMVALNLGMALRNQGKNSEAEAVLRDTLPRMQRVHGPEHEHTLRAASCSRRPCKISRSTTRPSRCCATRWRYSARAWGRAPRHPHNVQDLATLLTNTRRCSEAEELSRGALAQARRTLGPEHPDTLNIARVLGRALSRQQGKAVEAEALLTDTLAIQQRVRGPDHPDTRRTAQDLQDLQRGEAWRDDT